MDHQVDGTNFSLANFSISSDLDAALRARQIASAIFPKCKCINRAGASARLHVVTAFQFRELLRGANSKINSPLSVCSECLRSLAMPSHQLPGAPWLQNLLQNGIPWLLSGDRR